MIFIKTLNISYEYRKTVSSSEDVDESIEVDSVSDDGKAFSVPSWNVFVVELGDECTTRKRIFKFW